MGHSVSCWKCGSEFHTIVIFHPGDPVFCDQCEPTLIDVLKKMGEPGFAEWVLPVPKRSGLRYVVQYRATQAKRWRFLDRRAYTLEEAQARINQEQAEDNAPYEYRVKEAVL